MFLIPFWVCELIFYFGLEFFQIFCNYFERLLVCGINYVFLRDLQKCFNYNVFGLCSFLGFLASDTAESCAEYCLCFHDFFPAGVNRQYFRWCLAQSDLFVK